MTEQVGIVIGVDARQTAKLTSAAAAVDGANKQQLKSAQARLKTNDRLVESLLKEASATGVATKAQIEQIAATRAASAAIETEVLAIRSLRAEAAAADAARLRQLAAQAAAEKEFDALSAKLASDEVQRLAAEAVAREALFRQKLEHLGKNEAAEIAAAAEHERVWDEALREDQVRLAKRLAWEKSNADALYAQKLEYLGKNAAAETAAAEAHERLHEEAIRENYFRQVAANEKLDRLHAAAIAEDITREKARTAAIARERSKASLVPGQVGTGLLSAAGVGFGANALGAGLGAGLALGYSSNMAIQLERTNQALVAVTGSSAAAAREFQFVDAQAYRLGIDINKLGFQYAQFTAASKGTALEGEQARDIFLSVAEASQKLGLRTEETEGALRALGQMMSKGKVQAEELRGQLGDRLSGAFQIFARGAGLSTAELDKMLQAGGVIATEMLPGFGRELRKTFGTDANTQINTTISNFTRLTNEIKLAAAAFGSGFNAVAGPTAGGLAATIRHLRENPSRLLFGGIAAYPAEKAFAAITGSGEERFLPGADAARGPQDQLGPVATVLTAAQQTRVNAAKQEIALLGLETELQKTLYKITEGELRNEDVRVKAEELRLAKVKDRVAAEKAAVVDAKQAATEAKQAAEEEIQRQREYIAERIRLIAIEEDIAEAMTKVAAADMKSAMADEEDARTLSARNAAANSKFLGRLGTSSPGRRFDGYARIASDMTDSLMVEGNRYSEVQIAADAGKESQDQIEKYAREHEERLAAIKEEGERRRAEITNSYLSAGMSALGDAAEFAQAMGKKGFEAYKALSIAQTIISTIQSAQEAYKALVGSFPGIPGLGQGLAVAAAISATAAGIARVAAIKNQTYGGGREFGGAVSNDKFYEIGEKRKPEVVESAGRYYMFNANGRVQPGQAGSTAPASPFKVDVHNYGASDGYETSVKWSDGRLQVMFDRAAAKGAQLGYQRAVGEMARPGSDMRKAVDAGARGRT